MSKVESMALVGAVLNSSLATPGDWRLSNPTRSQVCCCVVSTSCVDNGHQVPLQHEGVRVEQWEQTRLGDALGEERDEAVGLSA